ncbi:hypothetical protein BFJ66_g18420 [Fusarium oxysporum f. sp. cepae]|uniref:Uncharacterized protein n=1 Tax=Fusarium oxysporum f. sp. cepae TaxID=396571 RepID=A0A3L6N164_FUSOX|nr:hypothetical protein BFJ66_g18420 [Fusarium oxysporum f. sp. cepae]RKK09776.1 hypothetical protein BFJ67_g18225 [Fusarium oxysporum f. sp. cepae]RKK11028.1 hypothetical protein BFJ65_g15020 [Fusarium oxysporum f. sp. cepae]
MHFTTAVLSAFLASAALATPLMLNVGGFTLNFRIKVQD